MSPDAREHSPLGPPPIERVYDLSDLSEAGDEVTVAAAADDLPRLADWFDIMAVERFEAVVTLTRKGPDRFLYETRLEADVVQACVVTLEPVRSHHSLQFSRALHVISRRRRMAEEEQGGVLTLAAGDDDAPEELQSYRYDLAAPLLEELSLDLDPYPRAPGVAFEPPDELKPRKENPFAVLARLKQDET